MQIVILGMHRSGTSALTRLLNLMGAYVGDESSTTPANEENPAGFWERKDVRALCDAVLFGSDADWWRPADFDPLAASTDVREEAASRWAPIAADLDEHQPWVLKEPRLCLVLPVLRPLLQSPVVVHVHRDPLEVAASLQARNGFPLHVGLALWEHYEISALHASTDLPRAHVWYGELMDDPRRTLTRLHEELAAAGVEGLQLPPAPAVDEFLSEQLHRQRRSPSEHSEHLTLAQSALLKALRDPQSDDDLRLSVSGGAPEVLRAYAEGRLALERAERDEREAGRRAADMDSRLARLEAGLRTARAHVERLDDQRKTDQAGWQELDRIREEYLRLKENHRRLMEDHRRLRNRRSVRVALGVAKAAGPLFRLGRSGGRR